MLNDTVKPSLLRSLKQRYPTARISFLAGGHHNLNFKITDDARVWAVRAPMDQSDENLAITQKEILIMKLLHGSLAPRLHTVYTAADLPVIETDFIVGSHKDLTKLTQRELRMLGQTLAKLHRIKKRRFDPGFTTFGTCRGTHLDYFTQNLQETILCHRQLFKGDKLVNEALERLRHTMNPAHFFRKTFSLTHGDIGPGNIIWNKHDIHFIDWSDGRYADPVDELGYIKAINGLSDTDMETLLESYCPVMRDRDIRRRLPAYELKNRIFDVVWALTMIDRSTTDVERKLYRKLYRTRAEGLERYLSA